LVLSKLAGVLASFPSMDGLSDTIPKLFAPPFNVVPAMSPAAPAKRPPTRCAPFVLRFVLLKLSRAVKVGMCAPLGYRERARFVDRLE
jgi:hypothetical protein